MRLTFEEGMSLLEERDYRELSRRARDTGRMGPEEAETFERLRDMLGDYPPERPPLLKGPSPAWYPLNVLSYPLRFFGYWWGPVMDHIQVGIDLDVCPKAGDRTQ